MERKNLSKLLLVGLIIGLFVSCSGNKNRFTIEGEIKDAAGKTLYLENVGVSTITLLDSATIADNGSFQFRHKRPDVPDFYRIRLNNRIINLAVDSTETIRISSNDVHFATGYTVEGSPESEKLKELTLLQLKTNTEYNRLQKSYEAKEISMDEYAAEINKTLENYKTEARKYIYSDPLSPSAYFALFQQINRLLIFDPYDKNDSKAFGAVANSWYQYYPNSPRSTQLYSLFTNSLAVLREGRRPPVQVTEKNSKELFDIALPSLDGKIVRLSDKGEGKVTLIDFTAYAKEDSPTHNILLAEMYTKYQSKGFEIYQISLDTDEHFWKNAGVNLPWICVLDMKSVYSSNLTMYNVSKIPSSFIRNKEGEIVARIESYKDLEKEIVKYLK